MLPNIAIGRAIRTAREPEHWEAILNRVGQNFHLIDERHESDFFANCELVLLVKWVAGKEGVIESILLALTKTDTISSTLARHIHLSLQGLAALALRTGDRGQRWQKYGQVLTRRFRAICVAKKIKVPSKLAHEFAEAFGPSSNAPYVIAMPKRPVKQHSPGWQRAGTHRPLAKSNLAFWNMRQK